jgi:hypothetical protein
MVRNQFGLVSAARHAAVFPTGTSRIYGGGKKKYRQHNMDPSGSRAFHIFRV